MILNLTFVLKKTTLMLVFNLLCLVCVSQNSFKKSFESNLSYGRILPHRGTLKGIILKNSYSFEASLIFIQTVKKHIIIIIISQLFHGLFIIQVQETAKALVV